MSDSRNGTAVKDASTLQDYKSMNQMLSSRQFDQKILNVEIKNLRQTAAISSTSVLHSKGGSHKSTSRQQNIKSRLVSAKTQSSNAKSPFQYNKNLCSVIGNQFILKQSQHKEIVDESQDPVLSTLNHQTLSSSNTCAQGGRTIIYSQQKHRSNIKQSSINNNEHEVKYVPAQLTTLNFDEENQKNNKDFNFQMKPSSVLYKTGKKNQGQSRNLNQSVSYYKNANKPMTASHIRGMSNEKNQSMHSYFNNPQTASYQQYGTNRKLQSILTNTRQEQPSRNLAVHNITSSFIRPSGGPNQIDDSLTTSQSYHSSNLKKILNLKELNVKKSFHMSEQSHPNDYNSIQTGEGIYDDQPDNQMAEENMSSTMNKFFQKRSRHSKVRSSGKQQFDKAQMLSSSQDYNNSSMNQHEVTLLSQIARRKDYESQQRQNLIEKEGIQNQIFLFQPSSGTQSHAATTFGESKNQASSVGLLGKARKNPYKVREQKFERFYQEKLKEIRKDEALTSMNVKQSQTDIKQQETKFSRITKSAVGGRNPDIAIYKERNDQYKILSNRIKTRSQLAERKYVDKNNIKILEKFFDPLRIRLRVQPISRAPQTIGKNEIFYFIEAGKLSLKGELPKAIELLKRGLELKPSHYLCRFNHGVLLFKLGLIIEATQDFTTLLEQHPNDPLTAYNLAICKVQFGDYPSAIDLCQLALDQGKNDKTLIYDAYKLRGICLFRTGNIQESIRNYNLANRIKQERDDQIATIDSIEEMQERQIQQRKEMEFTYINLFIEETKIVFDDPKFKKQVLQASKSVPSLAFMLKDLGSYFQRFASERDKNVKSQKDHSLKQKPKYKTPQPPSPQFGASSPNPHKNIQTLLLSDNLSEAHQGSNLSPRSKLELTKLKSFVGNVESPKSKLEKQQEKVIKNFENLFYDQLKEEQRERVDGRSPLRFDRIYSFDESNKLQLNEQERAELDKRKKLELDLMQTIEEKSSKPEMAVHDKLIEMIMNSGDELTIMMREVEGTQSKSSLSQVRKKQIILAEMLEKLRRKFYEKEQEWEQDFAKEIQKYSKEILMKGEEVVLSAEDFDNGDTQMNRKSRKELINKVSVIQKLQESLKDANITPHDVQNILIRDKEDRQRAEMLKKYQSTKSIKRLSPMQIVYIKEEFSQDAQQSRDVKMLDRTLKNLKFFRRFDVEMRYKIYKSASYLSVPGQKVIFNQGDIGDKLYIIIKGRVAVQINSLDYGRLPIVVSTLNDGDQFGELSLISVNNIQDFSNKQGELHKSDFMDKEDFYKRRKATCLTVEDCDLLVLSKELSIELYQPEMINDSAFQPNQQIVIKQDELNTKIAFLQSCQLFKYVDAQHLMPIACNMIPITYSFGEYILKEGEIPKGLYLIKSGQCKAALARIADRQFKGNYDLNKKLGDRKKITDKQHPLFHEFDTENTLLNEVKTMTKGFQNNRIYVDEKGEQIRDKIVYQDIMTFTQLMPRKHFGGRVLLPFDMYINLRRIYCGQESLQRIYPKHIPLAVQEAETEEEYQLKSFLSIIADSGQVEVYILDKTDMSYMPDHVLKQIFEQIAKEKEADRPFTWDKVEEKKEQIIKWEQFKVRCVQQMFIRRMQESNFQKASR